MRKEVRDGRRKGGAVAAARAACKGEGPTGGWGAGHAAERTLNMPYINVTRDVSRLSSWLNADADCRVGSRGEVRRGEVRKREGHKVAK